jgi:chromate reductase
MKILAFGASSSSNSINKTLASYAANLVKSEINSEAEIEVIDLNDFEMPIYSTDREKASGIPEEAQAFRDKIGAADALIISFAEHNGNFSAAYKNTFDWASRLEGKVFQNKPAVLLATSPGERGGATVLAQAVGSAPHFDMVLKGQLSVPSFYDNFKDGELSAELKAKLKAELNALSGS